MLLQMPEDVNIIDKVKEWNIEYLNPKQYLNSNSEKLKTDCLL